MGTIMFSANPAYNAAVNAAHAVREAAISPTSNAAAVKAANIAYFRAARSAAMAYGASYSIFMMALRELGTGGE